MPTAPTAAGTRGQRVLVVEDDALNQRLAQRMLGHLGYDVDLAGSGREALEALALRPYAAVLMDGHLPEMDGFATTRALRAREGDGTRTPVIAVSGATLDEDHARPRGGHGRLPRQAPRARPPPGLPGPVDQHGGGLRAGAGPLAATDDDSMDTTRPTRRSSVRSSRHPSTRALA